MHTFIYKIKQDKTTLKGTIQADNYGDCIIQFENILNDLSINPHRLMDYSLDPEFPIIKSCKKAVKIFSENAKMLGI